MQRRKFSRDFTDEHTGRFKEASTGKARRVNRRALIDLAIKRASERGRFQRRRTASREALVRISRIAFWMARLASAGGLMVMKQRGLSSSCWAWVRAGCGSSSFPQLDYLVLPKHDEVKSGNTET